MRPSVTSDSSSLGVNTTVLVEQECLEKCSINASMLADFTDCSTVTCNGECDLRCGESLHFNIGNSGAFFTFGNVLSLAGLLATFVTYCFFAELRRTNTGKYLLNLIAALFIAKFAFQINPLFHQHSIACSVMAIFQHYFCLAAFLWSNVITFNLWREVRQSPSQYSPSGGRMYPLYLGVAWGIPISVVIACSVIEFVENRVDNAFQYGHQEHCGVLGDEALVYSLAVPLVIITLTNIGMFMLIVHKPHMRIRLFPPRRKKRARSEEVVLYERSSSVMAATHEEHGDGGRSSVVNQYGTNDNTSSSQENQPANDDSNPSSASRSSAQERCTVNPGHLYSDTRGAPNRSAIVTSTLPPSQSRTSTPHDEAMRSVHDSLAKLVWIFAKMAILMSFAWLAGFLAILMQTYLLWILFVILNAMQGIFIFVSFTASPPALDFWRKKWKLMRKKWNRRARYRKFEDHYKSQQSASGQQSGGQAADSGQQEQTAVIVPSVAELTV